MFIEDQMNACQKGENIQCSFKRKTNVSKLNCFFSHIERLFSSGSMRKRIFFFSFLLDSNGDRFKLHCSIRICIFVCRDLGSFSLFFDLFWSFSMYRWRNNRFAYKWPLKMIAWRYAQITIKFLFFHCLLLDQLLEDDWKRKIEIDAQHLREIQFLQRRNGLRKKLSPPFDKIDGIFN